MAVKYLRLFDPTQQFQLKGGQLNVAGRLYVHLEATDDLAPLFDEYSTQLTQPVILDNNGRAPGLFVDSAKTYWLDVQDQYGDSVFTIRRMTPCGGGGGSNLGNTYEIVSTDGSISIDKFNDGGTTTYDIGIAPGNSDEFLEWIKCSEEDCGSTWIPVYQEGTMETTVEGIHVHKGQLYHFTNTFYVDPDGTGINYDTFKVNMYCNETIVDNRQFDIDSSLNDSVQCEFSTDLIPEEDGYVYFKLTIPSTCEVTGEVQCHRIYSGINAVPDTCATKQWVQETFDYNLSSKVDYSAIEYNQNNEITGISGSAIAAGSIDSAFVSSVASSYAESAVSSISSWSGYFSSISSKVDQSAFDDCCSAVHSSLDEKLDKSASGMFQPSGEYVYESAFSSYSSVVDNTISAISSEMSAYVPFSGLEHDGSGRITAISGSGVKGHEYTGIDPVWVDNTADQIGVYRKTLAVDETMTAYETGDSAVIGVNTAILSSYAKASSLEDYQLKSAMTAYASVEYVDSGMSGKLDVTASSLFLTSLPADLATTGDVASAVSGKLDNSASGEWYPKTGNPSGFLTAHQSLAGYATEQYVDSSVSGKLDTTAYNSAQFILTSQSGMFQPSGYYQPSGEYLSATESSNYYSTSNPSGFLTSVDLTPYQKTADMSAYQPSGDYQTAGNYLSSTDSAEFLLTSQSGLFQPSGNYQPSGEYLSATESSNYYSTSNPSGFLTSVDLSPYQLTADMSGYYTTANESGFVDSAYVEGQVSGKQDASAMTAYQPAGDYQPSGDYIYVSALGWAEV